ncbi:ATP-binding protein [Microbacterium sp. BWT-B31]|uniref:sensor histidine kinase n=1 Tax=Microbacterium sp. BWT-B31 TaxID=3232072 RepID=UPI0035277811
MAVIDPGGQPLRAARCAGRARAAGARASDHTRARAALLNQLLLASVVFLLAVMVALGPFLGDVTVFFFGAVAILVLTAATFVIPWNRLAPGWVAAVPALDFSAIGFIQLSAPQSLLGLLWIFPVTWLASGFGLLGLYGAIVAITATLGVLLPFADSELSYPTILLPLVLLAIAATSYLTARRSEAQRILLAKQAQLLTGVLERTRRQEEELTEVLDAVDFGVIRIGPDGEVAVTNEAHGRLQRALGVDDRAGADGDEVAAFLDDGVTRLRPEELPLERALRGEAFDGQVVWFGEPVGARRALNITARRLSDPIGADAGAVVVSRDVTTELTALQARDDLVASVSHELRTPLTSILGYLDLALDDEGVPEPVRARLEIAERNAERLLGIVGDLLAASSSSPSSVELAIAPRLIEVDEIARSAAEAMLPRAATRAITLDVNGLEPASAWADPLRLRQVVDNLLSNAITYNRDGGSIFLGTTTDGSATWILVRDTGTGIDEAERARLFQRYYRAGARRGTGSGLGLAISRDIVRAHGGDIGLHSSPGVGTTFVVKLPALEPDPPAAEEAP